MIEEKVGDVILGDFLVDCAYEMLDRDDGSVVPDRRKPLLLNGDAGVQYLLKEEKDGWKRERWVEVDLDATDPTRATSEFRVISVRKTARAVDHIRGEWDNGFGCEIVVERVDNPAERIFYGREMGYTYDAGKPATILRHDPPKPVTEKSTKAEMWAEIQRLRGSLE